ncbi:hypothetical protein P691DRAFT_32509 [Macrolepiota fuliginosa MF-IS2]|uniref:Uncharacterized protein n=1 Tax=Macrolepiota fuliginosa MF-IS2 TaxID=1400762 RepID=A0A9P5XDH0_9AGAR|nr:hypothetical protein P691DRAFT_32509 [Macrolepiota fuliginosa MF-IS2]
MYKLTTPTQGTAIYVYTILANTKTSPTGDSDMTFYLDGDVVGTFVKNAPGTPGFIYNVCVYANDSLPSGEHFLQIQNGHTDGNKTLLLLDYLVYSTDDNSTTVPVPTPQGTGSNDLTQNHRRDSGGVIVGAVLGTLGGLLLLGFGWLWFRRWQFRRHGQWKGKHARINKSQELIILNGEEDDWNRQQEGEVGVGSRELDSSRRWSEEATVATHERTPKAAYVM